jgi:hypothetical protein
MRTSLKDLTFFFLLSSAIVVHHSIKTHDMWPFVRTVNNLFLLLIGSFSTFIYSFTPWNFLFQLIISFIFLSGISLYFFNANPMNRCISIVCISVWFAYGLGVIFIDV